MTRALVRNALSILAASLAVTLAAPVAAQGLRCDESTISRSRALSDEGWELYRRDEYPAALEKFLCSMASHPTKWNTAGALNCSVKLASTSDRLDDIVWLIDELRSRFHAELDPDDFDNLGKALRYVNASKRVVVPVSVQSNVGGAVLIDGHPRGKVESRRPRVIWMSGGAHALEVRLEGFVPHRSKVQVVAKKPIDVDLRPIDDGVLDVATTSDRDIDLFVDGVSFGKAPFAGRVRPGRHVVWARRGDRGSLPMVVEIARGKVEPIALAIHDLGAPTLIEATPATATLELLSRARPGLSIPLGRGKWTGRLPTDDYDVRVADDGYITETRHLEIGRDHWSVVRVDLRKRTARPGYPFLGLFASYLRGGSFGGGADATLTGPRGGCDIGVRGNPFVDGAMLGPRFEFAFPYNTAFEVEVGYLGARMASERDLRCGFGARGGGRAPVTYALRDSLSLQGTFLGIGGSFRRALPFFTLVSRTTVGLVLGAAARDDITATAVQGTTSAAADVAGARSVVFSTMLFIRPEIGAEVVFGGFRLAATMGMTFFPLGGPAFPHADLGVRDPSRCSAQSPADAACAPDVGALRHERAYGPFTLFSPALALAYTL